MIQTIILLHPSATVDHIGILPDMLDEADPRPAKEQFDTGYAHGGGWSPFGDGQWRVNDEYRIKYPGDPWLFPLAMMVLREEMILIYELGIVAIFQPDGTFEIARMD